MLDLPKWWTFTDSKIPLPGKLTDYAALVQRYNRTLFSRSTQFATAGPTTVNPDTNRVGLVAACDITVPTTVQNVKLQLQAQGGVVLFSHSLFAKAVDTAAVTPSPFSYVPLNLTALDLGPFIQQSIVVSGASAGIVVSLVELFINPSLDGGV
jgi:hypothetical protein